MRNAGDRAHAAPPAPSAQRRREPLSADRYRVHFTADAEFRDLLERVRALASHRLPSGDLKDGPPAWPRGVRTRVAQGPLCGGKKPRASKRAQSSAAPSPKRYRSMQRRRAKKPSRYVLPAMASQVYERDSWWDQWSGARAEPSQSTAGFALFAGARVAPHASRRSAWEACLRPTGLALRCARSAARRTPHASRRSARRAVPAACPGICADCSSPVSAEERTAHFDC